MLQTNMMPRPRPPAKARRRGPSVGSWRDVDLDPELEPDSPTTGAPPPYTHPFNQDSLLRVAKSYENISQLLLRADGLIRERENELNETSRVCKDLYENNLSLKNKHSALLARMPVSPAVSPSPSSAFLVASPLAPSSPLPLSPPPIPETYLPSSRRIGVSAGDMELLADQNAELTATLEQLQAESDAADKAARRRLTRLESEIQTLREELERSQARSEELEQRQRAELNAIRRNQTESRRRSVIDKLKSEELEGFATDSESTPVRDFTRPQTPHRKRVLSAVTPTRIKRMSMPSPSTVFSSPSSGTLFSSPQQKIMSETVLVEQLLATIQELEETSTLIPVEKIRAVQQNAEHISRIYDSIREDDAVEWMSDDTIDPEVETINFHSLHRSIDGSLAALMEAEPDCHPDMFAEGIEGTSTVLRPSALPNGKTRKSLAGLFGDDSVEEEGEQDDDDDGGDGSPTQVISVPVSAPVVPPQIQAPPPSTILFPTAGPASAIPEPVSPSLSALSLNARSPPVLGHTLGSELGDSWLDDADDDAERYRARNTSLENLAGAMSPSPLAAPFLPPPVGPSAAAIAAAEESPDKSRQSIRLRRMTETVRARTSQWVNGRFNSTLLAPVDIDDKEDEGEEDEDDGDEVAGRGGVLKPINDRISSAVNVVVEAFDGLDADSSSSCDDDEENYASPRMVADTSTFKIPETPIEQRAENKRKTNLILEVWLWLQFALVIVVFLWAMARRGPKSVLDEAGRRRRLSVAPRP